VAPLPGFSTNHPTGATHFRFSDTDGNELTIAIITSDDR